MTQSCGFIALTSVTPTTILYLLMKLRSEVAYTARKTIFSFSGRPEKMVFPKLRWNMIFLVLSCIVLLLMIFLFPENMILHLRRILHQQYKF